LACFIAELTNAVFIEHTWPEAWKEAIITGIWKKKGDRADKANYRPIALLQSIARLVERLVVVQLQAHVHAIGALPPNQHGFRAAHDATTALTTLVTHVCEAQDHDPTLEVLVSGQDLRGAFETVDHQKLLRKLKHRARVAGPAHALMTSYLGGRRQSARLGPKRSTMQPIDCGVPQGSVLGPLLFALYVADVAESCPSAFVLQYADDTTLIVVARTTQEAVEKMNRALAEFSRYCILNLIAPEPSKTQMLRPVSTQRAARYPTHLMPLCRLEGCELPYLHTAKILGVLIDEHLTWEAQAQQASNKARAAARAITKVQSHLRDTDMHMLAQQLGRTYLDPCLPVWAGGQAAAHDIAAGAYCAVARAAARQDSSESALAMLAWPTWPEYCEKSRTGFIKRVLTKQQPKELADRLSSLQPRSRRDKRPRLPYVRTAIAGEQRFERWAARHYAAAEAACERTAAARSAATQP
jgi:hypothetical protein